MPGPVISDDADRQTSGLSFLYPGLLAFFVLSLKSLSSALTSPRLRRLHARCIQLKLTTYTILFLPVAALYLPLLSSRSHFQSLRPSLKRSFKASLISSGSELFFTYVTATRSQRTAYDSTAKTKERHTVMEPPEYSLFRGVLAPTGSIKPAHVDAIRSQDHQRGYA